MFTGIIESLGTVESIQSVGGDVRLRIQTDMDMSYVPAGMFGQMLGAGGEGIGVLEFLLNCLLPVTIGNIIGGAFFVGGSYYLAYLKQDTKRDARKLPKK